MSKDQKLRDKFGDSTLFGNEKDDSFKSSIGQIYQTFGGDELYPSVEEKAAMLLYQSKEARCLSEPLCYITNQ